MDDYDLFLLRSLEDRWFAAVEPAIRYYHGREGEDACDSERKRRGLTVVRQQATF